MHGIFFLNSSREHCQGLWLKAAENLVQSRRLRHESTTFWRKKKTNPDYTLRVMLVCKFIMNLLGCHMYWRSYPNRKRSIRNPFKLRKFSLDFVLEKWDLRMGDNIKAPVLHVTDLALTPGTPYCLQWPFSFPSVLWVIVISPIVLSPIHIGRMRADFPDMHPLPILGYLLGGAGALWLEVLQHLNGPFTPPQYPSWSNLAKDP